MAVQRYSREEMQAIITSILNTQVTILPIGNHELKRHLVYNVKTCDGDFVFKYYYQSRYGGREISTLKLLEDTNIKHPKLINSGTFGEDREWLMMSLLSGIAFNKILCKIPKAEVLSIFNDMGKELAKLHELKTFSYFGDLKRDLTFETEYSDYTQAFLKQNEYVFNKIRNDFYEDKAVLLAALNLIEGNLHLLDHVKVGRLTHSDFCPRNIFVAKENNKRILKAVLDYELCRPWDKNSDFSHLFLKNFPNNPAFEKSFFDGYKAYSSLDASFNKTFDFYMLNLCLSICSWAKETAPAYYKQAFTKLKIILKESKNLRK